MTFKPGDIIINKNGYVRRINYHIRAELYGFSGYTISGNLTSWRCYECPHWDWKVLDLNTELDRIPTQTREEMITLVTLEGE